MSNSPVFFVPAARCCARFAPSLRCLPFSSRPRAHGGFGTSDRRDSSIPSPPMRGGWSADRRTLSFGRACDARPPCPGATGTSLGAPPWRFSDADPRSRLPAVEPEPQRLPAPSRKAWRSGSGPPALRFAPQRGTPLPAPPSGSSPETPLMSEDGDSYISTSICSQDINAHRSQKSRPLTAVTSAFSGARCSLSRHSGAPKGASGAAPSASKSVSEKPMA